MKTLSMIIFFFICNISTIIMAVITPYITRKTESFGISIPEEVNSCTEIKEIRGSYIKKTLISCGVLALIVLAAVLLEPSDAVFLLIPASMLVNLFFMYVYYMNGHKKMKDLKAKEKWTAGRTQTVVIDTSFRSKKSVVSPLWFLLYAIMIVATAAMGIALYDEIPARIPMHWNIEGAIDRWADKSYMTIMWVPLVQIFMTFTMMFSYWMIGKSKQVINSSNPEVSSEQNRLFRYRWTSFIIITGLALLVLFVFIQLFTFGFLKDSWLLSGVIIIFTLGILIGSIVLSIKTGQGGSRIHVKGYVEDNGEKKIANRDEDKFWKLGLIYCNPDDPSIFVEKRFGVGWTINFGRPGAWAVALGFIVVLAAFTIAVITFTK